MRVKSINIKNFRTIESLEIDFHQSYTAICGANDSGKTNVVRAIRSLIGENDESNPFSDSTPVTFKEDFPKWKTPAGQDDSVIISADIEIDKERDAGLYQSTLKQLTIEEEPKVLSLTIKVSHKAEKSNIHVQIIYNNKTIDGLSAQEVLNRIQSANSIVFHNSTAAPRRIFFSGKIAGELRDLSPENENLLKRTKKSVNNALARIAKGRQKEFEELLGKLERKYKVGLSLPTFDFSHLPFNITLGETAFQVSLEDWGSGTRNRTQILLALFSAKKISESEATASKTTPVLILEEPECFLHPSAQAEFGRIVRDLAEEFQIQVIVTTHSPYLLSLTKTSSNILLERKQYKNQLRGTDRIGTTEENWMEPFSRALGLASEEFRPWRELFSSGSDVVFLVEGETDKEYLELMRSAEHGDNRLNFSGDIVPYGGYTSIANITLLRFVQSRYRKVFVTYDLDAERHVIKCLESIGLQKGKDFIGVGKPSPGKQSIEGLLPDSVKRVVRDANPNLVDAASHATGEDQKSARNRLKSLYLSEFKRVSKPNAQFFSEFYPIVKLANKCLNPSDAI